MALVDGKPVCDGCGRQALLADGVIVREDQDVGAHYCQDCQSRHQGDAVVEQDGRRVFRAELDRAAAEPEDDDAPRRRRARDED